MLKIIVVQADGRLQSLDLKSDTILEMEETAPAFDTELQEGTFALPFELPWTERNRRILQSAEFLESAPGALASWTVDVYDDNTLEIAGGLLTLLGHKGRFDYTSGSTSATITGTASRFGRMVKTLKLPDITFGDDIAYWQAGSGGARVWAKQVTDNGALAPGVGFAPVYAPSFIDTDREDYDDEQINPDTINNVGRNGNNWVFEDYTSAYEGTPDWCKYRTVPFLNLFFIFQKVMEQVGFQVQGQFLEDVDYKDLFVFNNYALERYNSQYEDTNRRMRYANHVPAVSIADFLTSLQNTFNLRFDFSGNTVFANSRNSLLSAVPVDYSTRCTTSFETTTKMEKGIRLQWTAPGDDSLYSELVKDVAEKDIKVRVKTLADLIVYSIQNPATEGDIALLTSDNYLVHYDEEFGWSYYSDRFQDYTTGAETNSFQPGLSPLATGVISEPIVGTNKMRDSAATGATGTYINGKGKLVKSPFSFQIFYLRKFDQPGYPQVPISFTQAIDKDGVRRVRTALSWHGSDGLVEQEWKPWLRVLDGDTVKVQLYGLPDFSKPVLIKGVLYLVKKRFRKIGAGYQAPVETELVRVA